MRRKSSIPLRRSADSRERKERARAINVAARNLFESVFNMAKHSIRVVQASFGKLHQQRAEKFLRVIDSASLGDKRFVAVVSAGNERYLIGGSSSSVVLLSALQPKTADFSSVLQLAENQRAAIQ